ncbi:unnamed protein product [Calypogeia fissa]
MVNADANGGNGGASAKKLLGGNALWGGGLAAVHCGLIMVQLGQGGANVLMKVAMTEGVNTFVFAVYRDLVGLAILIPTAYFAERKQRRPLTFPILGLMFGSGMTGIFGGQCFQLLGFSLASVSISAALPISTPIFAFLISLLFGVEKINCRTRTGQVKALAIVLSISGAVVLCTVKGAAILAPPTVPQGLTQVFLAGKLTADMLHLELWQLGGICFILGGLNYATFIVLQVPSLTRYPAPISLTAFSYLFGSIMLASTALVTLKDSSVWVINEPLAIIPIVYTGVITSAISFVIMAWAIRRGGPLLVAFYIPLQSFAATLIAHLFLRETIFMGSVGGSLLICAGLYLITLAKAKDLNNGSLLEGDKLYCLPSNAPPCTQTSLQEPLLR